METGKGMCSSSSELCTRRERTSSVQRREHGPHGLWGGREGRALPADRYLQKSIKWPNTGHFCCLVRRKLCIKEEVTRFGSGSQVGDPFSSLISHNKRHSEEGSLFSFWGAFG